MSSRLFYCLWLPRVSPSVPPSLPYPTLYLESWHTVEVVILPLAVRDDISISRPQPSPPGESPASLSSIHLPWLMYNRKLRSYLVTTSWTRGHTPKSFSPRIVRRNSPPGPYLVQFRWGNDYPLNKLPLLTLRTWQDQDERPQILFGYNVRELPHRALDQFRSLSYRRTARRWTGGCSLREWLEMPPTKCGLGVESGLSRDGQRGCGICQRRLRRRAREGVVSVCQRRERGRGRE